MVRFQRSERSSFGFARKTCIPDDKDECAEVNELDMEPKAPPRSLLPLIHHISTESLFELFQPQKETASEREVVMSNEKSLFGHLNLATMPGNLRRQVQEETSVAPCDALGSHRSLGSTSPMLMKTSGFNAQVISRHELSPASSAYSDFRDDDDASSFSRKSSTSSFGTPLKDHTTHIEVMAAHKKEAGVVEMPLLDTQQVISHIQPDETPTKLSPQYEKPLPSLPSQEQSFSVCSVLPIMRSDSFSGNAKQPQTPTAFEAPVTFRRQPSGRTGHGSTVNGSVLRSKKSTSFKVKSSTPSSRSRRGARLGTAMSEGRPCSRGQTVSNVTSTSPGSARMDQPRPFSISFSDKSASINGKDKQASSERMAKAYPFSISFGNVEEVIFEIMKRLDEPTDLLAVAAVNRQFRETFKRREPQLVYELLLRQCPAAWEFQTNRARTSGPSLSFRNHMKDKTTLTLIKSALLASPGLSLRPDIIAGLFGVDVTCQARVDTALWRIWSFCKEFGHRSLSADDLQIQVDWLNSRRLDHRRQIKNSVGWSSWNGLSITDLEDLLELWDAFGVTLLSLTINVPQARAVGIFNRCSIDESHTEEWFLEEWVYHIRSLGLPAMLSLASANSLEQARVTGYTEWTSPVRGQTRAGFFRAAITAVYQERVLAEAATKARQFALPPRSQHRPKAPDVSPSSHGQLANALGKDAAQPPTLAINTSLVVVRRKPVSPIAEVESPKRNTTWQPETPDSLYSLQLPSIEHDDIETQRKEVDHDLQRQSSAEKPISPIDPISPIRNSMVLCSLGMTPTISTRLGATLFPMEYPPTPARAPVPSEDRSGSASQGRLQRPAPRPVAASAVVDPVDKAMKLLTEDMGFSNTDATRALAKCDTGFGIDIKKAIEMLASECGRKSSASPEVPANNRPSTSPGRTSVSSSSSEPRVLRGASEGHYEPKSSADLASSSKAESSQPLCDRDPLIQHSLRGTSNCKSPKTLTRVKSITKAKKVLGMSKTGELSPILDDEEDDFIQLSTANTALVEVEPPRRPSLADQHSKTKLPMGAAKNAGKNKLMDINEEPSGKAMRVLGVKFFEINNSGTSPIAVVHKSRKRCRRSEGTLRALNSYVVRSQR